MLLRELEAIDWSSRATYVNEVMSRANQLQEISENNFKI